MITIEGESEVIEVHELSQAALLQRRLDERRRAAQAARQAQMDAMNSSINDTQARNFLRQQKQDPRRSAKAQQYRNTCTSTIGGIGGGLGSIFNIWNP
jgi:hypothetical protein